MNTAHFKESEFACKHCGEIKIDSELLAVLELLRNNYQAPVTITSGYRCPTHNANVGGAPKSKHVEGIAADVKVKGSEPDEVYRFLDTTFPNTYGIGLYKSWVHIDVRKSKGRWG